jgi:hypothetical protein
MANPDVKIIALTAAVANGISVSQTPGAAGNLTITGSLASGGVATLSSTNAKARRVLVSDAGSDAAVVFTIVGTDRYGNPISETVTGVTSATPIATKQDFQTVTRVSTSAATTGAITVGTNTVGSTDWIIDNIMVTPFNIGVAVSISSGTATYTVEHTYDDPNASLPGTIEPASYSPPLAWPDATLVTKTANGETTLGYGPNSTGVVFAHRLTITAGTGTVVMQSIQAGNNNWG